MISLSISTYAQEIGKKKSLHELKDEINPLNFARVNFYKNTLVFFGNLVFEFFNTGPRGQSYKQFYSLTSLAWKWL